MLDYLSIAVSSAAEVRLSPLLNNTVPGKHLFDDTTQSLQYLEDLLEQLKHQTAKLFVNICVEISNYDLASLSEKPVKPAEQAINTQALLSKREKEILKLVFEGLTNKQISEKLFISFETVKSHRKNILSKTDSKNTASLIHKIDISKLG